MDRNQLSRANEEFAALLTEAVYADLSAPHASGRSGIELCHHVMNAQRDVLVQLRQGEQTNPPEPVLSDWVQDAVGVPSLGGEGFGDELARQFRRTAPVIEQELTRAKGQGDGIASDIDELHASHIALMAAATRRLAKLLEIEVTAPTSQPDEPAAFIHEWAKAIVTNDVAQMAPFTSDDWVLVDKPGVITRDTFHRVVADGVLRHTAMAHEVLDVSQYGPVAVVRTHGTNTAIFQGTGIEADEWTTNILVADDDGWRCVLTQLTPRTATP